MGQDESPRDLQGPSPASALLSEEEDSNNSGFLGGGLNTAAVGGKKAWLASG